MWRTVKKWCARPTEKNFPEMAAGVFLIIISTLFVYRYIIPYAIVGWDEAANLLWGLRVYSAIRISDLSEAVSLMGFQYFYPPLQSLFWGLSLLSFPFTIQNARITNLFWYVMGGFLIYALGISLPHVRRHRTGFIALLLYTLSPMVLVHAGLGLKEMIGTTLTLASIAAYFKARETNSSLWALATGIAILLLALTKYNYAIYVIVGLLAEFFIGPNFASWRATTTKLHWIILSVVGAGILAWIAIEGAKVVSFFAAQADVRETADIGSFLDKLLFYPKSVVYLYSPHVLVGIAILAGFAASLSFAKKYYQLRFMSLLVLINTAVVGVWTNNLQDRFIMTVAPLIFLLAAWSMNRWVQLIEKKSYTMSNILFLLLLIISAVSFWSVSFRTLVYATGSYSLKFPLFNQPDYKDSWFVYNKSLWSQSNPWQAKEQPQDVFQYIQDTIDTNKPYDIVGYTDAFSPKLFELLEMLQQDNKRPAATYPSYVITIEVLQGSRYFTREYAIYNSSDIPKIRALAQNPAYHEIATRTFADLKVRVTLYTFRDGP